MVILGVRELLGFAFDAFDAEADFGSIPIRAWGVETGVIGAALVDPDAIEASLFGVILATGLVGLLINGEEDRRDEVDAAGDKGPIDFLCEGVLICFGIVF